MSLQRIRTTVDIPLTLLKKADEAVGNRIAESRDALILRALE